MKTQLQILINYLY